MNNICLKCNCKLRVFKKNLDWNGRRYHHSCYKEIELERACQWELQMYAEMIKNKYKENKKETIIDILDLINTCKLK